MAPEAAVAIPPSPSFVQAIYLPSGDQEMKIFPFPSNGIFIWSPPVLATHITRSLRSTEMISLPSGDQPSAPNGPLWLQSSMTRIVWSDRPSLISPLSAPPGDHAMDLIETSG